MSILRRLRGVLGMAVIWGVGFAVLGVSIMVAGRVTGLFPDVIVSPIPCAFIGIGSVAYGLLAGGIGAATVRIARRGDAPEIAGAPDALHLPPTA